MNKQRPVTTVTIEIVWLDPERGIFQPATTVTGPAPDALEPIHLASWLNRLTSYYLAHTPIECDLALNAVERRP